MISPQLTRIATLVKNRRRQVTEEELNEIWRDTNDLVCLLLRARERLEFEGNLNESLIKDISAVLGE